MSEPDLKYFMDTFPSLTFVDQTKQQKIICSLTKHELPATVAAVESYVKGKKFKYASRTKMYNYDQHRPHIIPSTKKKHSGELFCTLTLRHIAKSAVDVERHVNGKRFKRALTRWQKCQETGEKFMPRGGARKRNFSDNETLHRDAHFWSDSAEDDRIVDDEDMDDLYPANDFDGISNGGKTGYIKIKSVNIKTTASTDSNSDYEMEVLDNKVSQILDQRAPGPHSSLAGNKSNRIKKRKNNLSQTDHDVKHKKKQTD